VRAPLRRLGEARTAAAETCTVSAAPALIEEGDIWR
jgi:hypothetical protein